MLVAAMSRITPALVISILIPDYGSSLSRPFEGPVPVKDRPFAYCGVDILCRLFFAQKIRLLSEYQSN